MLTLRWFITGLIAATIVGVFPAASAAAAPPQVDSFMMYGTTVSALESWACSSATTFAEQQPNSQTLPLVLDFGAAREWNSGGDYGAKDFSSVTFGNSDILSALESASNCYHNHHVTGGVDIIYGNNNSDFSGMSNTDIWNTGYKQSLYAENLSNYEVGQGYTSQDADAASDMEPSYAQELPTKQLLNGAAAQGFSLYWDYGSADGCPESGSSNGSCNNGWDVSDVAYVSYNSVAVPLPEIYDTGQPDQWTVIRKWFNNNNSYSYYFFGTTGLATGGDYTPAGGWNQLQSQNSGMVGSDLDCFSSTGC